MVIARNVLIQIAGFRYFAANKNQLVGEGYMGVSDS